MDAKKISRTSGELAMSEKRSSNGGEVVISVLSEETPRASTETKETKETSSSTAEFAKSVPMSSLSPKISRFSTSPNKAPKIPTTTSDTPTRKKSLGRSVYSKPKSRFGEQPYSVDVDLNSSNKFEENTSTSQEQISRNSSHRNSLKREPSNNKLTNSNKTASAGEPKDDDEEEILKIPLELINKKHKRVKIKNLVEWFAFACILGCLVASLTVDHLVKSMLWDFEMWKWCVLVMVICFGMLVSKRFMKFIVFLIEKNFLFKKKVLYFVHGLKKSVQVFIWLTLVLSTWVLLFKHGVERSETATKILNIITWTLVSLLIGAFLWLVKTLLLKILASNFHIKTFNDRIQESVFHQLILQSLLSEPRYTEEVQSNGNSSTTRTKKGKEKEKKDIDIERLHKLKQEKVSAWAMKGLVDVVMNSGLTTISNIVDETVAEGDDEQTEKEITEKKEPAYIAHRIFKKVAKPNYTYIEENDLLKFMIQEWVDYFFSLLDNQSSDSLGDKTMLVSQINITALTDWVVKVYKERKALAHALNDTKTAVKQLNKLVIGILIVVTIIVWLLLTKIATTKVILLLSSQLVVAAFMFGNTCRTIFEAIIFVFVMHPFDVGDRCVIDGVQLLVEEMNILNTVFLKLDQEKVYYPNSVLATKPIGNYYRSSDMGDNVEFSIGFSTPVGKIEMLKEKIKTYLENNSNYWHPTHNVVVKEIENVNKIKMALYFNHKMNFQDFAEKNKRRTELVIEIKKIFEEINIKYNLLPQKVHLSQLGSESIGVTN